MQGADEDSLRHYFKSRAGSNLGIEPRAISHGLADALAEHRCHTPRGRAGGEPPRLEHDDTAALQPWSLEQHERDEGRLAGTGRRLQHRGAMPGQRSDDAWRRFRDRQPRSPGGKIR